VRLRLHVSCYDTRKPPPTLINVRVRAYEGPARSGFAPGVLFTPGS
jgi:hypothetical protein